MNKESHLKHTEHDAIKRTGIYPIPIEIQGITYTSKLFKFPFRQFLVLDVIVAPWHFIMFNPKMFTTECTNFIDNIFFFFLSFLWLSQFIRISLNSKYLMVLPLNSMYFHPNNCITSICGTTFCTENVLRAVYIYNCALDMEITPMV